MKKFILLLLLLLVASPALASDNILKIQNITSPSGIKAWLVEDHTIPVISIRFAFRGSGSENDGIDKQGLAHLLSNTLDEGAGNIKSAEFQKSLEDNSIELSFSASRDDFGGSLKTLSKNKDTAFNLLNLALTQPRFDKEAVDRMIAANLSRIRSDMTDPDWMLARLQNAIIYKGHPYALNSGGTLSTLPKLTANDLRAKVKNDLRRDRLIVSVAGDMTPTELAASLDKIFAELPKSGATNKIADIQLPAQGSTTLLKQDIPQTLIAANLQGIDITDPDYFAGEVMNFIFGSSGFGSRLMEVIREQHGLTYGIYSDTDLLDHAQTFGIGTSTKNETAKQVVDMISQEIDRMINTDVTQTEINDAKSYLIGSVPLSLTSTDQIAGAMLSFQARNLPADYLNKRADAIHQVTIEDVRRVAKRLLVKDKLTYILVGNPQNIPNTTIVTELPNVK